MPTDMDMAKKLHDHINSSPGKRLDASQTLESFFSKHPEYKAHFGDRKLKKFVKDYPELLRWDDSEPTLWVYPVKAASGKQQGHTTPAPAAQQPARRDPSPGPTSNKAAGRGRGDMLVVRRGAANLVGGAGSSSSILQGIANMAIGGAAARPISSRGAICISKDGNTKQACYEQVYETTETVKTRPVYDVIFVLDTSGSMAGAYSRDMLASVRDIITEVLEPNDRINMILFNDATQTVLNWTKKKNVNFDSKMAPYCVSSYHGSEFKCGGLTALWDAVAEAMKAIAKRDIAQNADSRPHLIVLSDGEDNMSSKEHNLAYVRDMLHQPGKFCKSLGLKPELTANFQCSLISVGNTGDAHVRAFEDLTAGKPNLHHYSTSRLGSSIKACFGQVKKSFTQQHKVTVQVSHEVVPTAGPSHSVVARAPSRGRQRGGK